MVTINIKSLNKHVACESGQSLMTALNHGGVFVDNPCNGKGTCGKCKVKIIEGAIKGVCETEKRFLSSEELDSGIRLSCMIYPQNDLALELLQEETLHKILTSGKVPNFPYKPALSQEIIDSNEDAYGVAVDIGTTTVVAVLVNLLTGEELEVASMINPQKQYGLDVLTRITYAMENPDLACGQLQGAIVVGLNELVNQLVEKESISKKHLHEIVVSANTTMLHMLLGVDSTVIGKSPYTPNFIDAQKLKASDIGLTVDKNTLLYCLPSVSAYIGSDIVAGVYACDLHRKKNTSLFIDIGTNGEIVLLHDGKLMSCSCAAGPALEGMNISAGMRAQVGAIEEISIKENVIKTEVIGDVPGVGLCGSGILATLRELLKTGIVTKKGAMIKLEDMDADDYRRSYIQVTGKKRAFELSKYPTPILVTQSDVRQIQLAKGALLSGFYALLNEANISMDDLDEVIVAGQFGAHLSADSLIGTGILPEGVRGKLTYIGNASKTGAYMALMSTDVRRDIETLARDIDYIELGTMEGYERLFAQCLLFK